MNEKKNNPFKKTKYYFLAAALLIGIPHFLGFYNGQTGHILVATEKAANDPNFSKSVIYIYYNGIWGAQGIVINKPVPSEIVEKNIPPEELQAYDLFKGGPIDFPKTEIVALDIPSKTSHWRTQPLTVVSYNSYKDYHDNYKTKTEPNTTAEKDIRLPLYFGFSSWATGQLEAELRHGVWRVLKCDSIDFNDIHISDLWEHLSGDLQTISCASKK